LCPELVWAGRGGVVGVLVPRISLARLQVMCGCMWRGGLNRVPRRQGAAAAAAAVLPAAAWRQSKQQRYAVFRPPHYQPISNTDLLPTSRARIAPTAHLHHLGHGEQHVLHLLAPHRLCLFLQSGGSRPKHRCKPHSGGHTSGEAAVCPDWLHTACRQQGRQGVVEGNPPSPGPPGASRAAAAPAPPPPPPHPCASG